MARNLLARTIFFALAGLVTTASAAFGTEAAATRPACLSASETREEISARHLMEPFAVLKGAAAIAKAEALSAKLCRLGEEYVYEIALLDRRGRLVHLVMSATTGKVVNSRNMREAAPRT
ncbi:MAG TPA: hypothetical protein VKS78_02290 [Roseiarcus sp.]|nr:hypothetical protein [Roseiarcus sp.]